MAGENHPITDLPITDELQIIRPASADGALSEYAGGRPFSLAVAFHGQSESKGADEESDQDQGMYTAEDQHDPEVPEVPDSKTLLAEIHTLKMKLEEAKLDRTMADYELRKERKLRTEKSAELLTKISRLEERLQPEQRQNLKRSTKLREEKGHVIDSDEYSIPWDLKETRSSDTSRSRPVFLTSPLIGTEHAPYQMGLSSKTIGSWQPYYSDYRSSPSLKKESWTIRGCDIIAETNIIITNEAHLFQRNTHGFSLSVVKDSLPAGLTFVVLNVKVCASGPFKLPSKCDLMSAVYWIKPDPPCIFTKPLTVKLEHCAAITNDKQLSCLTFVRAHCTQPTLPYTFKEKQGGTFSSNHGIIELTSFSGYAIASTSLQTSSEEEDLPSGDVRRPGVRCGVWKFSTKFHSNQWQVRVIVARMLAAIKEVIEIPAYNQPRSEYDFDMVLDADTKTLCIPSDTVESGDWELSPCHKPAISYSDILQYNNKDSRLPGFYLSVLWKGSGPPHGVLNKRIYFTGGYKDEFFQVIINPEVNYRFHSSVDPVSVQYLPSAYNTATAGSSVRQVSSLSRLPEPKPQDSFKESRLEVDNLREVRKSVWSARDKWHDIGIELGIPYSTLSNIEGKDNGQCLTKLLVEWLKGTGEATPRWRELINALKEPSVGFEVLAKDLTDKNLIPEIG